MSGIAMIATTTKILAKTLAVNFGLPTTFGISERDFLATAVLLRGVKPQILQSIDEILFRLDCLFQGG